MVNLKTVQDHKAKMLHHVRQEFQTVAEALRVNGAAGRLLDKIELVY